MTEERTDYLGFKDIIEKYEKLKKINPKHRLLTIIDVGSSVHFTTTNLFIKEYWPENHPSTIPDGAGAFKEYINNLEKAIKEESEIIR